MPVSFTDLQVGSTYTRKNLASHWGYNGYQAIGKGVVTPSGTNYIILFVQREKRDCDTPYKDHFDGATLCWEGEAGHGNDSRIVTARDRGDEIHLFYRDLHADPFTYHGTIQLTSHRLLIERPSEFEFKVQQA